MSALSVVVPVYNEASTLRQVLDECAQSLESDGIGYEIVVVDDGSTDGSSEIAESWCARPSARLVRHGRNRGFGQALQSGVAAARHPWVMLVPSDRQLPASEIARLWRARRPGSVVCGVRVGRQDPIFRKAVSWIYNRASRVALGLEAQDLGWVKLYEREFLARVPLLTTGPAIDTEILVHAKRKGLATVNVPVGHFPREHGESKIRLRHGLRILKDLMRIARARYGNLPL